MRLLQLDILRAVAVLLVIVHHFGPYVSATDNLLDWILIALQRCGWIGVDLFFVLSGFLVSGLLFREYKRHNNIRIKQFLLRRGLKIYPAFYVFLLSTVMAVSLQIGAANAGSSRTILTSLLAESLFIQNYMPGIWVHTWSLAVEEHFYLLLALGFLLMLRFKKERPFGLIEKGFVAVAVLELLFRVAVALLFPLDRAEIESGLYTHAFPTHLRIDSLLFGVLLAYYHYFNPAKISFVSRKRWTTLFVCLALIAPSFVLEQSHLFMYTVGMTFLYLGFGGILLLSLSLSVPSNILMKGALSGAAYVGLHSYSIYLWHVAVKVQGLALIHAFVPWEIGHCTSLAVIAIVSIVIGVLMAKLIELPVLRVRDRLFPSRSSEVAPPQPARRIALDDREETGKHNGVAVTSAHGLMCPEPHPLRVG